MNAKAFIFCGFVLPLFLSSFSLAEETVFGKWRADNGKTEISVYPCANNSQNVCSAITWLKNPRKDVNNSNPSLRARPLIGVEVGKDMKPLGKNRWAGQVYSPKKGKDFPSTAELQGNVLKIKGCLTRTRLICKTRRFNRVL